MSVSRTSISRSLFLEYGTLVDMSSFLSPNGLLLLLLSMTNSNLCWFYQLPQFYCPFGLTKTMALNISKIWSFSKVGSQAQQIVAPAARPAQHWTSPRHQIPAVTHFHAKPESAEWRKLPSAARLAMSLQVFRITACPNHWCFRSEKNKYQRSGLLACLPCPPSKIGLVWFLSCFWRSHAQGASRSSAMSAACSNRAAFSTGPTWQAFYCSRFNPTTRMLRKNAQNMEVSLPVARVCQDRIIEISSGAIPNSESIPWYTAPAADLFNKMPKGFRKPGVILRLIFRQLSKQSRP